MWYIRGWNKVQMTHLWPQTIIVIRHVICTYGHQQAPLQMHFITSLCSPLFVKMSYQRTINTLIHCPPLPSPAGEQCKSPAADRQSPGAQSRVWLPGVGGAQHRGEPPHPETPLQQQHQPSGLRVLWCGNWTGNRLVRVRLDCSNRAGC